MSDDIHDTLPPNTMRPGDERPLPGMLPPPVDDVSTTVLGKALTRTGQFRAVTEEAKALARQQLELEGHQKEASVTMQDLARHITGLRASIRDLTYVIIVVALVLGGAITWFVVRSDQRAEEVERREEARAREAQHRTEQIERRLDRLERFHSEER